ncbi:acyltransferase family protein [Motiliproteus sp. SC1-56]|uniref:acyltransferase family protein n=1 Tax=Motiliproteus sp. SC1-56 TaxID=2799565 RepID=UPI001A908C8F|nr:acyltransferase family protein [Motiliproteus sp. SC1-56]
MSLPALTLTFSDNKGTLTLRYRKEIDGLRTVAVLPVIFFHAGLLGMSGGYVGVDIFFVISGYLITTIIYEEIEQGRFSILNFYERRARRILPALTAVLVATTVAALLLMPASLLKTYSQSLVSVVTFSSNVFFFLSSGYFSTASDEMPLLHTWSLAVEEQYYIFFPLMMSALWFLGKVRLALIVLFLTFFSLLLANYMAIKQAVDANFYLIFSRAWELFVGSLIAIGGFDRLPLAVKTRNILSIVGIVFVICSVFIFDEHTPFPSFYTLLPVLGAALVICFGDNKTLVGKVLSVRPMVSVGLISYSLYLWHQPLFAFLRMKTVGEPAHFLFVVAIALTFALAVASYRHVEKPFRNKQRIPRKQVFQFSAVSIALFLTFGFSGHVFDGYESRFDQRYQRYLDTATFSPKRRQCHTVGENYLKPDRACTYFSSDVSWAIFGDSHMVEPAYALAKMLEGANKGLLHLSFSGCPPALLFGVKEPGCSKWIDESTAYLERKNKIENVVLGFRYSSFLFGNQLKTYPEIPNRSPVKLLSEPNTENLSAQAVREMYWESFRAIVERFLAAGKQVYVIYPIPELPTHIKKGMMPFSVFSDGPVMDLERSTPASFYLSRNEFILKKLDSLPYGKQLHAIKPFEILCSEEHCPAVLDETALYFDDDHLSVPGAQLLLAASEIGEQLAAPGKTSAIAESAPAALGNIAILQH